MTTAAKPYTSIPTKLAEVMAALGRIEKKGFNKHQNYRFVRESDVVEALVPLLAERHLFLSSGIVKEKIAPLYQTSSGSQMWLTKVWVEFTWHDGDTGETLGPRVVVGYGADTGDKGVYKAMTGAEKYFLMKTFLISTGDDPESDEKVDKAAAGAGARSAPRVASRQGTPQRGGRPSGITQLQKDEMRDLFRQLGVKDAGGIADLLIKVGPSGGTKPTAATVADWVDALTAEQAGKIVVNLTELLGEAEAAGDADEPEGDDDGFNLNG